MNYLSLFSGIGGLDLGLDRAGMTCVGQVEIDPFCRAVLARHWPEVPRHDDVRTCVEWWRSESRPAVDAVVGGFPCQPVSTAGRRKGQADERWLWPEMRLVVAAIRPAVVLIENVPGLLTSRDGAPRVGCLCGWPSGRRRLHLCRQEQRRQAIRRTGRRRHDNEGGCVAGQTAVVIRRISGRDSTSDGQVGRGTLLGATRFRGGAVLAPDRTPSDPQGRTGEIGHPRIGHQGPTPKDIWRAKRVERRCDAALRDHSAQDSGTQPQGSTIARAGTRVLCPACGRRVGDGPGRSVRRSGLSVVLGDLATCGYDARWDCLPAAAFGAPHQRDRVFVVAYPNGDGRPERAHTPSSTGWDSWPVPVGSGPSGHVAHANGAAGRPSTRPTVTSAGSAALPQRTSESRRRGEDLADPHGPRRGPWEGLGRPWPTPVRDGWWAAEPDVGRVAHGVPRRVDRLRALGNAVVPQVAEHIGRMILRAMEARPI